MLKMNTLSQLTNTPKSTILYYVKEGLLPEPQKDKPNFHLYDEKNIQLIEFIKYLQTNFSATISQIKALFAREDFDVNNPYKSLIHSLDLIMGAENETFNAEELCQAFGITSEKLDQLVTTGLINPRDGIFTRREWDMLAIIHQCDRAELELLQIYAQTAKSLAETEVQIGLSILQDDARQNERLKHFFDVLLRLKPYVLNLQTFNTYQQKKR
ncbi:MerR family transcriptional regulator [Bisgaard Taxon 10/6]|uniref:MerR family transcriptional regulator n=1 Tax=Exercitatus varius TaxID=67857 RepID=UPI00294B0027|nr:MerR family transcriptional regulator [Exercitatus varius]MDG2959682.1 MerR family transcriptional regulator [Exercitatus varius]